MLDRSGRCWGGRAYRDVLPEGETAVVEAKKETDRDQFESSVKG